MASLAFVTPILPDKGEAWRRFYQELSGPRHIEYELSRRRMGIIKESVWIAQTQQGESAIVSLEAEEPEQVIHQLAASDLPFDRWFRLQMKELCGFDMTLAEPPNELIFVWQLLS